MRHQQILMPRTFPPVELNDFGKPEIRNQIRDVSWDDDCRRHSARAQVVLHDGPQRCTVQMIEVGVRNQHHIDGRQISDSQAGPPQALQHKKPARKVGIDDNALPAHLQKETGVADESHAQLAVGDQARLMSLAAAGSHDRVPHQASEVGGALAQGWIAKCLLDHPVKNPGRLQSVPL